MGKCQALNATVTWYHVVSVCTHSTTTVMTDPVFPVAVVHGERWLIGIPAHMSTLPPGRRMLQRWPQDSVREKTELAWRTAYCLQSWIKVGLAGAC